MPLTRTGYANFAAFPVTGAANIIYVDLSNGNEYTWNGSAYVAYTGTLAGVRLGNKSAAWFTANPNVLLGDGQLVYLNDNSGQYKKGDGTTILSSLPFIGGGSSYTAGSGLTLTGSVFSLGGTLTGNVAFSGSFDVSFPLSITTPLIIGGTAVGSGITYKGTTGNGTPTGIAHGFVVGNNGNLPAFTILNDVSTGIGTTAPKARLHVALSGVNPTPTAGTTVLIESNTSNSINFHQPDANTGGLIWSSPSDSFGAFIRWGHTSGVLDIATANTGDSIRFSTANATERMSIDSNGNIICGTAAIATTATNGFLYVPTCAGVPTGTPTTVTGRVPIVADSTNNRLYIYSGGSWVALN